MRFIPVIIILLFVLYYSFLYHYEAGGSCRYTMTTFNDGFLLKRIYKVAETWSLGLLDNNVGILSFDVCIFIPT